LLGYEQVDARAYKWRWIGIDDSELKGHDLRALSSQANAKIVAAIKPNPDVRTLERADRLLRARFTLSARGDEFNEAEENQPDRDNPEHDKDPGRHVNLRPIQDPYKEAYSDPPTPWDRDLPRQCGPLTSSHAAIVAHA
jgi:hypothetical protein